MDKSFFKRKLVLYILWVLVAISFTVAMYFIEKPLEAESAKEIVAGFSNCFFVPGALISSFAILGWLASRGAYDGLGYIFSNFALHSLIYRHQPKKYESLYDYKQKKDEKGRTWPKHMLFVGLGTLTVSLILFIVYAIL